jgi:hypothetical protein
MASVRRHFWPEHQATHEECRAATGAFLGRDVIVGEHVELTLANGFTNGESFAAVSTLPVVERDREMWRGIELQNHPNPFNPMTTISFHLAESSDATLRIYTVDGRLVRTLGAGRFAAGTHRLQWDGRTVAGERAAAGVYLYRIDAKGTNGITRAKTGRMTLVQ